MSAHEIELTTYEGSDFPGPSTEERRMRSSAALFMGILTAVYPENRAHRYSALGVFAGVIVGALFSRGLQQVWPALLAMAIGAAVGIVLGRRVRFEICSDPLCKTVLCAQETCPNCGGIIAGTIRDVGERLEAAEEWERRTKHEERARRRALKAEGAARDRPDPAKSGEPAELADLSRLPQR